MSDSLALVIARAIRAERARAGLSQAELAERVGVHRATVGAIETVTRRVYADELADFCEALGVTFAELMSRASPEDKRRLGI
ncbi:MAG TPA: helix-turn-helix transcriptional regulator [Kineosporiaceae bacterium]|nr:helix-turn-helix transcriptional regulator [Kineosporiaceae bacterium]